MQPPSLQQLVGKTILAIIPGLQSGKLLSLHLLAVEAAGLWVESQDFTDNILASAGVATAPKTCVLFVPFQQVVAIYHAIDSPALSRKAFGVDEPDSPDR